MTISAASLIAADQLLLYTALQDGIFLGNVVAPFPSPLSSKQQLDILAEHESKLAGDRARFDRESQFDPELGWCPRPGTRHAEAEFDWAGSRLGPEPLPRERGEGKRLIGLIGCSFTLGSEVEGHETWAHGLDVRWPETRFGNFGVGGYGVDQALLRYRRDVAPLEPDEVWLGLFPPAVLRASSHFPPLYNRWRARTIYFKPRFSLDASGELVLHPSPARTPEDIARLIHDRRAFLEAVGEDTWIARARPAYLPPGSHWMHYSATARILLTLYERLERDVPPHLRDDSSEFFQVNRAILLTLAREVQTTGARLRVLIFPALRELQELDTQATGYWHLLCESLRLEGLDVLDLTPVLLSAGIDQSDSFWMPGGHHSPQTHQLIVEAITEAWGG